MTRVASLLKRLSDLRRGVGVEGYHGYRHFCSPEDFLARERPYVDELERRRDEPRPLARAHALANSLRRSPISFVPDELIVGSKLGVYVNPAALSPAQRDELTELRRRRAAAEKIPAVELSIAEQNAMKTGVYSAGSCTGHCVPDYASVIALGFDGLRRKIAAQLRDVARGSAEDVFLRSADIALAGAVEFAERHGEMCESLPSDMLMDMTRPEAREIAARCRRVPRFPAESFHDALQALWFAHVVLYFESPGVAAVSPGRLDRIFQPFYERDLRAGRLTEERARELIECLWVKLQEGDESQNVTLGGLTPDGDDATGDLTALMLDVTTALRLPQPSISVRMHPDSPPWPLLC